MEGGGSTRLFFILFTEIFVFVCRHRSSTVVVAKYDIFDYSHGEPSEEYLTVLRCLEVKNEEKKEKDERGVYVCSCYL